MSEIETFPDSQTLARVAAGRFVSLAADAIAAHGRFRVGLAGGSTPRALFSLLATEAFAPQIDWAHVHVFWGDERCVPPDHPDSNYRMARQTLLDHVPLPPENVHRMKGELDPAQAADEYEHILRMVFGDKSGPRFDLLLQGLGDDGHTASLFPGTDALDAHTRWVVANYVPRLETWRLTLTADAINAAAHVVFLVAGQDKAATLRAVLHGPHQPQTYPAQLIRPQTGALTWMLDAAAAARL